MHSRHTAWLQTGSRRQRSRWPGSRPRRDRPSPTLAARLALAVALASALTLGCASTPERDPGALATRYASQGRWPEAAREIELAIRANPSDPSLRRRAARIYQRAGNVEKGIGHLEMGIQMSPQDPELWIRLGGLENARENLPDAYVAFRRAAELSPADIRAVSGLALAADSLGFESEAEAAYARWADLEREQGIDEVPASVDTAPPAEAGPAGAAAPPARRDVPQAK
jgi:tetratricopeptide (TPR) repeat protein